MTYATPIGGLPTQEAKLTGKAVFTTAYAVIPGGVMRDIVTSYLPFWEKSRAWVLARPLSGFAETFSQYIVEIKPSGDGNVIRNLANNLNLNFKSLSLKPVNNNYYGNNGHLEVKFQDIQKIFNV